MSEVRHLIVEQILHLRRYAPVLVGDRGQADDLVQDCLERAWGRTDLWAAGTNMRAWLFTILHNLHRNAVRKNRSAPAMTPLETRVRSLPVRPTQEDRVEIISV